MSRHSIKQKGFNPNLLITYIASKVRRIEVTVEFGAGTARAAGSGLAGHTAQSRGSRQ